MKRKKCKTTGQHESIVKAITLKSEKLFSKLPKGFDLHIS